MRARGAAAIVALGLILCACGASTLTARELRMRASTVCVTAVRRSDRIAPPRSNAAGAAFLARGIAIFTPELTALRKLAPPPRLANAYRSALGEATQQLDALIATEHNLRGGDDPVVAIKQLHVELLAINVRDRSAWRVVGIPACSNLS